MGMSTTPIPAADRPSLRARRLDVQKDEPYAGVLLKTQPQHEVGGILDGSGNFQLDANRLGRRVPKSRLGDEGIGETDPVFEELVGPGEIHRDHVLAWRRFQRVFARKVRRW